MPWAKLIIRTASVCDVAPTARAHNIQHGNVVDLLSAGDVVYLSYDSVRSHIDCGIRGICSSYITSRPPGTVLVHVEIHMFRTDRRFNQLRKEFLGILRWPKNIHAPGRLHGNFVGAAVGVAYLLPGRFGG